jgi:hypothetical protein
VVPSRINALDWYQLLTIPWKRVGEGVSKEALPQISDLTKNHVSDSYPEFSHSWNLVLTST